MLGSVDPVSEDWAGHSLYLPQYFMWRKLPEGRSEVIGVTTQFLGSTLTLGWSLPPFIFLCILQEDAAQEEEHGLFNMRLKLDILHHMGR